MIRTRKKSIAMSLGGLAIVVTTVLGSLPTPGQQTSNGDASPMPTPIPQGAVLVR